MAFHQLLVRNNRWPLEPGDFLRPPLHTGEMVARRSSSVPGSPLRIGMVAVGFVVANPYAVLSFGRFAEDFSYTNATVPVYDASAAGETSYGRFCRGLRRSLGGR
jgi:hypothetical protein